ncbi:MAG: galactarate dehydratase, partial [Cyclobacteriaceae bacterium]
MVISKEVVRIAETDNVGVVTTPKGLEKGVAVLEGVVTTQFIGMGHKVALKTFEKGDAVIRYGHTISHARDLIPAGAWVNERNTTLPEPPSLNTLQYAPIKQTSAEPLKGYTFMGYRNPDGSVGTKNVLGISTSVQCV